MVVPEVVAQYHQQICEQWGHSPRAPISTGYEDVLPALRALDKNAWEQADEKGREQIIDLVFAHYRGINLVPINYYDLQGCADAIQQVATANKQVSQGALAVGNNQGLAFGRFWFPNMQDASWNDNDSVSIRARFMNDKKLRRAIKLCYQHRDEGENTVVPKNLRRALELVNGGTIQNFKPVNAKAIWEYICPVFRGRVLDFSSGYGGRLLGALTSNLRYHYTGLDPNTQTHQGLVALGALCEHLSLGSGHEQFCTPSEEFVPEAGAYDAAFSSPPYFNLETYTDEPTQCMNRYRTLDEWFDGYVVETINMTHRALNQDGIYAVNIADYKNGKQEFKIVEHWIQLAEAVGFQHVETINMMLNVRPGVGNNRDKKIHKSEGIYVFRKRAL